MSVVSLNKTTLPAKARKNAVRRLMQAWLPLWERAETEEIERLAEHTEAILGGGLRADAAEAPAVSRLLQSIAQVTPNGLTARIAVESDAQERYFAQRERLLQGALTAPQAAALLRTTRQTPHDRVRAGTLLAIKDKGVFRFPTWQFDADGPDGVVAGLPTILRALTITPLAKANWLTRPNPYLENRTPLEALKSGEQETVLSLAFGVEGG